MSNVQKRIDALRAEIEELEAQEAREAGLREAMESAHQSLLSALESAGIKFESYVAQHGREYRRALDKGDSTSSGRGRTRVSTKSKVKIPAGEYRNIPSDPEHVFTVKEKGPRPKAVREYAEEVGLEAFMARCAG